MPTKSRSAGRRRPPETKPVRPRRMGRPTGDYSAHAQILNGAAKVIGAKGLAECAVEDILEAAGVSRRTFYRFFRNKEEVYEALFDIGSRILINSVQAAVEAAKTAADKIEAGIGAFLEVQAQAGPLGQALMLEPLRPTSKLAARRREVIEEYHRLFENEVDRLRRQAPDPLVFRGLVAALEMISVALHAEGPGKFDVERGKRVMLRIAMATLALPGERVPPMPQQNRR